MLTLQIDEEGPMAELGIWGQVAGQLTGQVDSCYHHQLSQLWGGGGGLFLERLWRNVEEGVSLYSHRPVK